MNCLKCRKEIPADSMYCQFCGETIVKNKPKEKKKVGRAWRVLTFFFLIIIIALVAASYILLTDTQYIYFDSPYYELDIFETVSLKTNIRPSYAAKTDIKYASSDEDIVSINGDVAKANKPGTAIISVLQNNINYGQCAITVKDIKPLKISAPEETMEENIGRPFTIPFVFTPENTSDREMVYEFSDSSIAEINGDQITGLACGKVTITAIHLSTGLRTSVKVDFVPVPLQKISLDPRKTIFVGDTDFVPVSFYPTDASDKEIKWSSSSGCVKIENGIPVAKYPGTATLTARNYAYGLSESVVVEVLPIPVQSIRVAKKDGSAILSGGMIAQAGDTIELTAIVTPSNATDQSVTWRSSNDKIASVNKGKVTCREVGVVTITATASDDLTENFVKITIKPKMVTQSNGFILKPPGYRQCPVKVNAPFVESCYVYFKELSGSGSDFSMFVNAGTSCEVDVPVGKYKMYYASGTTWYGVNYRFGDETAYYTSPDIIECYTDSNYANGAELTLYTVLNGNMSTTEINEGSFPG